MGTNDQVGPTRQPRSLSTPPPVQSELRVLRGAIHSNVQKRSSAPFRKKRISRLQGPSFPSPHCARDLRLQSQVPMQSKRVVRQVIAARKLHVSARHAECESSE